MRAYQHHVNTVLDCYFAKQGMDKQNSLDVFLARQQRLKARHGEAQGVSNAMTATVTINAVISENDKEANHV